VPFLEAVWLAFDTIRVQKLKSFFTLLGVMIGVMFLIAVISIVEGMSKYVENDFAGKIFGVNTFTFRRTPDFTPNSTDEQWREWLRRPRVYNSDVQIVRSALPEGSRSAVENENLLYAPSPYAPPRHIPAVPTEASGLGPGLVGGRGSTTRPWASGWVRS